MFKELLAAEFAPYGTLSAIQLQQLEDHFGALSRWNEKLNLTRIRDLEEAVHFHYCESLFLAAFLPADRLRIVDVGSGGGFPGIPVAIFRPDSEIVLVESHQRKAVFLREATRKLANVKVISKRAEEVDSSFDWLISRAVAPADILKLKLADSIALLIGEGDGAHLQGISKMLPWGKSRVLFHVEHGS